MKSNIKTIKNLICYLVAFILVITANFGLVSVCKTGLDKAFAYIGTNSIELDNSNFNSNTDTKYPFKPNNWTPSIDIDDANVKAGVINLKDEAYQSYPNNDMSTDKYVLMIDSDGHNTNFGYTSTDTITLDADGYYAISVNVYTNNNSGIASIYLKDDEGHLFASLDNKTSMNQWSTFYFFIKTNDIESKDLTLSLFLEGNGIVLYDNIAINELNLDTYNLWKKNLNTSLFTEVDLVDNVINSVDFATDKPFTQTASENGANSTASYVTTDADSNASDGANTVAFKVENTKATYVEYSTDDDYFTFDQNSIQKVTVSLKAMNLSGKATLQLVETDVKGGESGNDLTAISITSNTSSSLDLDNDFVKYSFYIKGYPTKVAKYKLVVSLGDEDNKTSGVIYISNITTSKITDTIYTSANTGSTSEKKDLSANYTLTDQDFILNNGNFNAIKIDNYDTTYPYTPANWTITAGNGIQQYGVINTDRLNELSTLNMTNLSTVNDPDGSIAGRGGNNILMMYNASADTLSYTSETKSLDKKTYHKFSVQLRTENAPATISLVSTKDSNEIVLSSITVNTDYEWKTIDLYIYTGYQSYDVSLKVTLDSDAYAYAYIDNTMFNYLFDQTVESFDEVNESAYIIKTDLSKMIYSNSNEYFSTPNYFTGSDNDEVKAGVVDLNAENLQNYVVSNAEYVDTFKSLAGDNRHVLAIRSLTDVSYTFTSNIGFKLSANSCYKISVSVYTQNLQILDTEADQENKGATIKLTGFDEYFSKIESDNVWTTYNFYICPNNDVTTYLQLSLGGDVACTGDVFFGNITFVDEGISSLDDVTANATTLVLNKTTENTTEDEETETEDTTDNTSNTTWIYAIPTILFALAIVICIVGVMMRKVKFKKPTIKSKNKTAYDRNKTVSKQVYMRRATTLREEKLNEAQKELEALKTERAKYEEDYKHGLTKLREMKLKRIGGSELNKLEKDIKRNQKSSAAIGLNINRLENDIEYMKSDSYLNSLMKKLASEKSNDNQQPSQDNNQSK